MYQYGTSISLPRVVVHDGNIWPPYLLLDCDSIVNTSPPSPPEVNPDAYVEKLKHNWAKGACLELLNHHEYLDSVVNEYFVKFPWRLKVSEDPILPVSDTPSTKKLSTAEIEQKRHKIIAMCKAIRSWLDYCAKANHKVAGHILKSDNDPWTCLLVQLSGVSKKRPKALQAHWWWSKDHFDTTDEATAAVEEWSKALSMSPVTDPISRQVAIDQLPLFAGPILSGIHKFLGMHVTLIVECMKVVTKVLCLAIGRFMTKKNIRWSPVYSKNIWLLATNHLAQEECDACKLLLELDGLISMVDELPGDLDIIEEVQQDMEKSSGAQKKASMATGTDKGKAKK
ncbi:hypothetical protein SCLCIDRAFT_7561 [Scleroderma citrinum Foug A]|uniref:Uncharacterized protein n=1 Tax=Scleroderma citrinum Foug A TaxID=1036808 RepID=A0A0C3EHF4_9AGAM|nr:hypothetical protein SCLCIDRAFT_7561 [Scleroderma citrinum Foug A]